ncbi:Phenylalanine--tRNA ligase alpha subunit [Gemmata obscuriglobus]|uniref:Phenylalanine--tRNA ligase alpha subunit n=1 Tax=Gemmata obscuriglobus TaxID=114 RepID=A0A2Z3H8P5_9BACT|nr:phenylalanine--tRNA ligase subunit alpha [Gemmata obscuriglobus]AWM40782.1 phenylalanine--tRNA ligase subunit alpha [Gemmata obscuriglobus]QEG25937.1 Phenylalanine--tRNA ligase alpha subunit [Gemmata obscuriglobus]VTS00092.1 phenylalanyl-trna synthetase subunit alpha : Phenylalanine--tRNA ligase alpha subunit OS=Herpetosiphon aurantiacus (strain ATCC 23779 / DSM 785) GN=pheS PE=3 SV=1: Phe_tRNA-synt_N: tRNA-synt_2d [Gemmata obscuriglobus UQM 2246]
MAEVNSLDDLRKLVADAQAALEQCADEAALRAWNTQVFGEKGLLKNAMALLGKVPKADKPATGAELNRVKESLTAAYDAALADAKEKALQLSLTTNPLDVTLPGRGRPRGRLHPATQILRQIYTIFADLGFQVYRTNEVETDELNFEALNMPAHHPARDMWDTFFTTTPGVVLRTHTSPGQIHVMREAAGKPIRVILPGMCYRNEAISTRSEIQFYQVEGLVVGEGVTMADLKGTITAFARRMFGPERQVRIRSSYFPFTEPSIEVDIDWPKDDPNRDRLTKGTGWLEILGAGMVHPNVLRAGGYDPDKVTGFAFGMGPQRMLMLKHAIDDIRLFWQNDLRFLKQF